MTAEELTTLAERYYALVDQSRLQELLSLFHDDVVYRRGSDVELKGIEALRRFYERERAISSGRHVLDCIATSGDWIAVRGTASGTLRTGGPFSVEFADFHLVREGKIWRRTTYFLDGEV
jgi:ketosteroid isomerase-like protein